MAKNSKNTTQKAADGSASKSGNLIKVFKFGIPGLIGLIALGYAAVQMGLFDPPSKTLVYGEWIEQDVPKHAADSFVLNEYGVTSYGNVISPSFKFTGDTITFNSYGKKYIFEVQKDKSSDVIKRIRRVAPTHYKSFFEKVPTQ